MDIHRGSGPLRSGPTGPGSGFSVMPYGLTSYLNITSVGQSI